MWKLSLFPSRQTCSPLPGDKSVAFTLFDAFDLLIVHAASWLPWVFPSAPCWGQRQPKLHLPAPHLGPESSPPAVREGCSVFVSRGILSPAARACLLCSLAGLLSGFPILKMQDDCSLGCGEGLTSPKTPQLTESCTIYSECDWFYRYLFSPPLANTLYLAANLLPVSSPNICIL